MKRTARSTTRRPHRRHREGGTGVARKAASVSQRRKRGPALRRPAESLDVLACMDRLDQHCEQITALGELMEIGGGEPLPTSTLATLGGWIKDEIAEVKALAQAIWEAGL